jgi:hypothetical protein
MPTPYKSDAEVIKEFDEKFPVVTKGNHHYRRERYLTDFILSIRHADLEAHKEELEAARTDEAAKCWEHEKQVRENTLKEVAEMVGKMPKKFPAIESDQFDSGYGHALDDLKSKLINLQTK